MVLQIVELNLLGRQKLNHCSSLIGIHFHSHFSEYKRFVLLRASACASVSPSIVVFWYYRLFSSLPAF